MNSLGVAAFLLVITIASVDSKSYYDGYYYYPKAAYLQSKIRSLEKKIESMESPIHVHVHGNDEDHSAHSDLTGAHIHLHLSTDGQAQTGLTAANDDYIYATCRLQPNPGQTSTHQVVGDIHLRQKPSSDLEMRLDIEGFAGPGLHGFHIHESANFEKGCNSFGGHYNPDGVVHGGKDDHVRHVGDFGNIQVDSRGKVQTQMGDWKASLFGAKSVFGRGIVVHAGTDDLGKGGDAGSAKTGNAGPRLACCAIGWSKEGSF